jgi:thioesterase domain-containing protein
MVPAQFVRLDQLPVTENGKINRKALLSMASQLEIQEREKIGPRNETEQKLVQLWMALLHCQEPGIHDNFFTLGGTSLIAVRLLNSIKAAFDRELPLASLLRHGTIAAQAEFLAQSHACAATARSREPLVHIRDGKRNLAVLIHPVGGNILCYRELIERIPDDVAVVGLQSPGDGRERTVSALADAYASALATHLGGDRKVHLFGWSMGGVVGHELASVLESRGVHVASITMVDSWMGSGNRDAARALNGLALLRNFVTDFLNGAPLPPGFEDLERQDEPGKLAAAIRLLNGAKLLPEHMDEEEFIVLFNEHRANYQALVQHRPSPVAAPIRQFRAVRAQSFVMLEPFSPGPVNGERMVPSEVIDMDEDHFTIMRDRALQRIVERVFGAQPASVRLPAEPVAVADDVEETTVRFV